MTVRGRTSVTQGHLRWSPVMLVLAAAPPGFVTAQAQAPGGSEGQPKVVVTSKPVHSLVASVMAGVGEPSLLVDGTASPHTYAMKPSDAQKVHQAGVFFRVSENLEPFTAKLMQALPARVRKVTLAESNGINRLELRTGGTFEAHAHTSHNHGHTHGNPGSHKAAGAGYDAHVWLDPDNAKAMTSVIAEALSQTYPQSAELFRRNAAATNAAIDGAKAGIARDLAPIAQSPFVVLHDATQYFERAFGLSGVGSITVSPDVPASAKRLSEVRARVQSLKAVCVFSEPQVQPKVLTSVTEGTAARIGVLDPEGLSLTPGPSLYVDLLRRLASGFKSCLSPAG
jgi:zinc transport system substrate-binding protein